jgi:hypothetical protein
VPSFAQRTLARSATVAATVLALGCSQRPSPRSAARSDLAAPIGDASVLAERGDAAVDSGPPTDGAVSTDDTAGLDLEPETERTRELGVAPTPRLPIVPAALASEIARYRTIVQRTPRCHLEYTRLPPRNPPECARWFRSLDEGGLPAVHAIGLELTDIADEAQQQVRYGSGSVGGRLARSLARSQLSVAMPYLLRAAALSFVSDSIGEPGEPPFSKYEGVLALAGGDVQRSPVSTGLMQLGPQHDQLPRDTRRIFLDWSRWYAAHQHESPAQWQAQNLPRTREDLASTDHYRWMVGMFVLYERPEDRPAVEAAARRILEQMADFDGDRLREPAHWRRAFVADFAVIRRFVPERFAGIVAPRWR